MEQKIVIEENNETAIGYGVTLGELSLEAEKYIERRRKDGCTIKIGTFVICFEKEMVVAIRETREEILEEFYQASREAEDEVGCYFLMFSTRVGKALKRCTEKLQQLPADGRSYPIGDYEE